MSNFKVPSLKGKKHKILETEDNGDTHDEEYYYAKDVLTVFEGLKNKCCGNDKIQCDNCKALDQVIEEIKQ